MLTWTIFEITGVIAFAFSGAVVGLSRRMDVFGIAVLSVLTAIGGGIIRDILAGVVPPSALTKPYNLILSVLTACIVCLLFETVKISRKHRKFIVWVYNLSDTLGLASFTVTGAALGINLYPENSMLLPVMLGLITAIGGGILRDILAQRVPVVLKADVYAIASIFGAVLLCELWDITGAAAASWLSFLAVIIIRVCAIHYKWQLHHPRPTHIIFRL